jgi:hypothetical protein
MRANLTNARGFNLATGFDYRDTREDAFHALAQVAQKSAIIFSSDATF